MDIVIDTSIIISVIINEKSKPKIIKITEGKNLVAPFSLHWEIGNAFSAMFKRKKIDIEKAKIAIQYYHMIPIKFVDVDINSSIELSHNYKIYAYDAYFLECARTLDIPLISLDNTLLNLAKKLKIKTIEV